MVMTFAVRDGRFGDVLDICRDILNWLSSFMSEETNFILTILG